MVHFFEKMPKTYIFCTDLVENILVSLLLEPDFSSIVIKIFVEFANIKISIFEGNKEEFDFVKMKI